MLLDVAAEFEAHRGQQPVLEIGLAAGAESGEECGREHVGGDAFVDGRVEVSAFPESDNFTGECGMRDSASAPP